METLLYLLIVLIIAAIPFLEYLTAIPVGILFMSEVSTIPVIIAAIIGNWITVVLLILLVEKVRTWIKGRMDTSEPIEDEPEETVSIENAEAPEDPLDTEEEAEPQEEEKPRENMIVKQSRKARKYWDRFGLPGLAIIGTGLLSSHLTALVACSFGANRAHLTFWMTISIILWSIVLGALIHFGVISLFG